jgi:hypothetical protein
MIRYAMINTASILGSTRVKERNHEVSRPHQPRSVSQVVHHFKVTDGRGSHPLSPSLIGHSECFRCDYSRYPTSLAVQSKRMQVGSDHPEPEGWSNRPTTGPFFRSLPVTAVGAGSAAANVSTGVNTSFDTTPIHATPGTTMVDEAPSAPSRSCWSSLKLLAPRRCWSGARSTRTTRRPPRTTMPTHRRVVRSLETFDLPCSESLLAAISRLLTTHRTQEDHRHQGVGPEIHVGRPGNAVRDHPRRQLHGYQVLALAARQSRT